MAGDMTLSASKARIADEFDRFLFASIGEDRRGQRLSVLSALARSDIDPWQEAARLAGLPRNAAAARLDALLAALPGEPLAGLSVTAAAQDLIALLPRVGDVARSPPSGWVAVLASENARFYLGLGALAFLIAIALLIAPHSGEAERRGGPHERFKPAATGFLPPASR